MRLRGLAAVYLKDSEDMGFVETIAPGAFDGADMGDAISVFNHDKNLILGRASSGTLEVKADARGLRYEVELPDTEQAKHVFEAVRRGDVSGSSFAFRVAKDRWTYDETNDVVRREILAFETIYDTSPVVRPAYPDTSCTAVA